MKLNIKAFIHFLTPRPLRERSIFNMSGSPRMLENRVRGIAMTLFLLAFLLIFTFSTAFAQNKVLEIGISIEKVPKDLYGTWRVVSHLTSTNNPDIFKEKNVDLWNLSRYGDVLKLENPFSGAEASVVIYELEGNFIRFQKVGNYDNKKLTDTVKLSLSKETFTGVNELKLDTISEVDGHVLKTELATYSLKGEKISGASIK